MNSFLQHWSLSGIETMQELFKASNHSLKKFLFLRGVKNDIFWGQFVSSQFRRLMLIKEIKLLVKKLNVSTKLYILEFQSKIP